MSKPKNAVWRFFASVNLALFVLIILAATSIIGTLIKQGQNQDYYLQEYGPSLTKALETLELSNMYSSWWYIGLLSFFAVNLIVCTIERLPRVWRLVVLNNLDIDPKLLSKKSYRHSIDSKLTSEIVLQKVTLALKGSGWGQLKQLTEKNSSLLFAQKGVWSRLGVYVVHLSILVILFGAIIGNLFGFQAFVYLPEGTASEQIFLRKDKSPVPLGFSLRCEQFEKVYYPNGMVKQYRADLTVDSPELDSPLKKTVIVNDPLSHKGFVFFVGDSFPLQEYLVVVRNHSNNSGQAFRAAPDFDVAWQGTSFRLEELQLGQAGELIGGQVQFTTTADPQPTTLQIGNEETIEFKHAGTDFSIYLHQYQSVLLLVTKDPGVLTVYLGCALMVIGLCICLFLSHRRIWVHLAQTKQGGTQVVVAGDCNKNKLHFEQRFQQLSDLLEQSLTDPG